VPTTAVVPAVRHLVRARDLADANLTEPLTVDDLAAAACLSRAHFSREFRRAYGMAIPGPPVMDDATRAQAADLTAKGFAGTVFLETDDAMKAYDELSARGVEFTEKPTVQPYGIDCGFRDPSGNSVRLAQRTPMS